MKAQSDYPGHNSPLTGQTHQEFSSPLGRLSYLLYLPRGYYGEPEREWPFILFLHGAGEKGDDLEMLKRNGIPHVVERDPDFPFVCASPQCAKHSYWSSGVLKALVDTVVQAYRLDRNRLYCTGLSMGGFGTWYLALDYPDLFAAIAPICGGGEPEAACRIKDLAVWVFHGAKDRVVLPEQSIHMVEALRRCGGNVEFTLYPDAAHDSWTQTYANPALYTWFLQNSRK